MFRWLIAKMWKYKIVLILLKLLKWIWILYYSSDLILKVMNYILEMLWSMLF